MTLTLRLLGAAAMLLLATRPATADPTTIDVRVIARGAKFLGGYTTPVRVTLTDAETSEMLARGITSGTTGDTQRSMAARGPPPIQRSSGRRWISIARERSPPR
ncbi:MAG: hypothetical protein DI546_09250 [Rhizobium sp.]|nr:MAG: hypothetical protein DI546_09250 [Rhizobium sp.]